MFVQDHSRKKRQYSSKDRLLTGITFLLPLIILAYFSFLKIFYSSIYESLIQEDSLIEYMQSLVYLITSLSALIIAYRCFNAKHKRYGFFYLIFVFAFIFLSLEEMSWGQRIFKIANPEYFAKHNVQEELTVHNLDMVQPFLHWIYITVAFSGAFFWLIIQRKMKADPESILNLFVPSRIFIFYFLPVFFVYLYLEIASRWIDRGFFTVGYFFVPRDQEPAELLLSFGFFLFLNFQGWKHRNARRFSSKDNL